MTLREWRKENGVTQGWVAKRLGKKLGRTIHTASVCQWESGTEPSASMCEAIRELTGGKVTGYSFKPKT